MLSNQVIVLLQSPLGKARKEKEDAPFFSDRKLFRSQQGMVWWKDGTNYKKAQTF